VRRGTSTNPRLAYLSIIELREGVMIPEGVTFFALAIGILGASIGLV
jgi:hypothetical protein